MRPFQIIMFGVFGALAVGGLLMFAAFRGFDREANALDAGVTIWGTLNQTAFDQVFSDIVGQDQRWGTVKYLEQETEGFSTMLTNSIAEGNGPDLVLLPHDLLVSQAPKLSAIPYENLSVREYRNAFAEGAEIFLFPDGFYGFPFAIDPLVMYWNRDIFSSARLAYPPRTWEELVRDTVPAVTKRQDNNDLTVATIAFGEYANVQNAKQVVLMLLTQAGSRLVEIVNNNFLVQLNIGYGTEVSTPADAAIRFFTQFANPSTVTYSWNRGMQNDREAFLSEELALYFGFGSEYSALRDGNANLNFDVAEVPQGADEINRKGYGTIYAFTIPKTSKNPAGAYEVAQTLTMTPVTDTLVRTLALAPARRDLIAAKHGSAVGDIIYQSALIARGWLDPEPVSSSIVLKEMIEAVTSGRNKISESIEHANYQIQKAF
jgi:multiple sugar transport system substrate-binding protein